MVLLCMMKKTGVFSGETMVLECHMLRLNACKDSCEAWAFLDAGQLPEEGFHRLENLFQRKQEGATFHRAASRCRTEDEISVWVFRCIFPRMHCCSTMFLLTTKHVWAKLNGQKMISENVYDLDFHARNTLKALTFLYFNSKVALFYFTRRRFFKKNSPPAVAGERWLCSCTASDSDFII